MNIIAKIKSRRAFQRQLDALTDTGLIDRIDAEQKAHPGNSDRVQPHCKAVLLKNQP